MASFNGRTIGRRTVLQSMVGVAALSTASAFAQKYPDRVVSFLVQAAPGGSSDLTARVLAEKLSELLGQQVIIINEPRASGALAVRHVAGAAPDGYTMLMLGSKSAIAASFGKSGTNDLTRDLTTVAMISSGELAIITSPVSPLKDMADLVRKIKSQPGKVTIGVGDVTGGIQHLGAELFKKSIQGDFLIVPYGSNGKLMMAVRGGEIDAAFELLGPVMGPIKDGVVRSLAITGPHRYAEIPAVPTIAEAGFPNYQLVTNSFVAVPAKTPPAIVARLNAAINEALKQPDLQARSKARGSGVPDPTTPNEASVLLTQEIGKWHDIIQSADVKLQ